MKIAVCVKQVPARNEGMMDPKTGSMIRNGSVAVNTDDMAALELAAELKEACGASLDAFTMGPPRAEEALKTCFEFGADRGFLLCDPAFAGADVLATSYTLSQGILSQGDYDLVICGSRTTDGDTGQVSGALSRWLDFSFYNGVTEFSQAQEQGITIRQRLTPGEYSWQIRFPCVISVDSGACVPRIPSLKAKLAARSRTVRRLTLQDLRDPDCTHYGAKGSATRVKKVYTPPRRAPGARIHNENGQAAGYLYDLLKEMRIVE